MDLDIGRFYEQTAHPDHTGKFVRLAAVLPAAEAELNERRRMDYSIAIDEEHRFIHITVRGIIDRKIATAITLEAHALGRQHGISRYLQDVTAARNVDTVTNNYRFANNDMNSESIDRTAVVAILVDPEDHSHDFIETLSRNAGLNVTLFRNRKDAIDHLGKSGKK